MPRGPRLDAPGTVHHVLARGIERRKIFRDDKDREEFLERLEIATQGDGAFVYAWALMPNHFHLTIRSGTEKLATVMKRLLTGYAVVFNHRHKRSGHLFQNRYKSIVVDDDTYLLGLVRYIHLNPLRAGIVRSIAALARYPWTGHAVLMGHVERTFQDSEEILGRFGRKVGSARKRLSEFMSDLKTAREERYLFTGGGLVRSAGGMARLQKIPRGERQLYDERILGDGRFVQAILDESNRLEQKTKLSAMDSTTEFERIRNKIGKLLKLAPAAWQGGGRSRQVVRARAILAYVGICHLGLTGREVAVRLGINPSTVSRSASKGEEQLRQLGLTVDELLTKRN